MFPDLKDTPLSVPVLRDREAFIGGRPATRSLRVRYAALHREMLEQLERAMARENHWLFYTLLGWQHLVTCAVSYYLVEVARVQAPHRWVYGVLWFTQAVVALTLLRLVRGRPEGEDSPLKPLVNRVWTIFLLLCGNVAMLNVTLGLPVFTLLPVLATLSSFAFLVLSALLSRRFVAAALVMFVTGMLMAHFPAYGFLLYGAGWLLVLQGLGVIFRRRQRRWLAAGRADFLASGLPAPPSAFRRDSSPTGEVGFPTGPHPSPAGPAPV
jgi:hypothetical protein